MLEKERPISGRVPFSRSGDGSQQEMRKKIKLFLADDGSCSGGGIV